MARPLRLAIVPLLVVLSFAAATPDAHAVEGKWTPSQLLEHDPEWLRELGLEIPVDSLWSTEGGGLLEAVAQVQGCSAGFVSPDGLLLTNHHCVFGMLQEHSSPENDYIENGLLTADRSAELSATGARATLPQSFEDVTATIEATAEQAGDDDRARIQAIEAKIEELIDTCEAQPRRRCQVAIDDDGVRYRLMEAIELPDVRLVYAPPRAVGEFGGEVDNWSWPRHTGDFALVRLYVGPDGDPAEPSTENVPYQPRRHFQIARQGVAEGDFVMVAGFPGRTQRSLIAAEMELRARRFHPRRSELLQDWIEILQAESERSDANRITLASRIKGLANREKNSRGQVAGVARGRLIEAKRQLEAEVLAAIAEYPEHAHAAQAHRRLEALTEERIATWDRDFLLGQMAQGPVLLATAVEIARWSHEQTLDDGSRHPAYRDRTRAQREGGLRGLQQRLHLPAEKTLITDFLRRLAELPSEQSLESLEPFLAALDGVDLADRVSSWVESSQVQDLDARLAMLDEDPQTLAARNDPLLDLAQALVRDQLAIEVDDERRRGAISRWRPLWRRALAAHLGRPLDPDANGTLRISLAHVEGYAPRDAVWMEPVTRLAGVVEKHTGVEPFDAPEAVLAAAPGATTSPWADEELGDVAVGFLATGDTTGGSSGSPVLDARGELVGVNFDRVWENIANDFGYVPTIARNISADVRYLLWMLDTLGGPEARPILRELGIEPGAGQPGAGQPNAGEPSAVETSVGDAAH